MAEVAVVVPAFEAEKWLAETLDSVLSQSVPPTEVSIVVDLGTTDRTEEVARFFEPDVSVVLAGPMTSSEARQLAFEATTSALVAPCDADDVWLPHKLERQVAELDSQSGLDGVFCRVDEFISPEVQKESAEEFRVPMRGVVGRVASALLIRRKGLNSAGGFATEDHLAHWIRWVSGAEAAGLRFGVLDEVLVRRRLHSDSFTRRHRQETTSLLGTMRGHLADSRARRGDG